MIMICMIHIIVHLHIVELHDSHVRDCELVGIVDYDEY